MYLSFIASMQTKNIELLLNSNQTLKLFATIKKCSVELD